MTIPNTDLILIERKRMEKLLERFSDLTSIRNERRDEFCAKVEKLMEQFSENAVTLTGDAVRMREIEKWQEKKYGNKNSFKTK